MQQRKQVQKESYKISWPFGLVDCVLHAQFSFRTDGQSFLDADEFLACT